MQVEERGRTREGSTMFGRHPLIHDELYGKEKGKGDRPYTPVVLKLLGLAKQDHDTREEYAPLPEDILGVSATAQGLLFARILFAVAALVMLSLILPLRQMGFSAAAAIAARLGDAPDSARTVGIIAQWTITLLGLAIWGGTMPEFHGRFVEAPTIRHLVSRFVVMTGIGSIVWLSAAVLLR